ncbi:MAG: aldo/keto reductase [Candidatus Coatesbacteria bacterium]
MKTRRLGRTGLPVPEIGVGGYSFQDATRRDAHIAVIRRAVELGVTLIDTAPGYGASEETVGIALEGLPREQVILSTKYYPYGEGDALNLSGDDFAKSLARSLERMKTTYVDLIHLHWVHTADDIRRLLVSDVARVMRRLQTEGKVRYLAVSEATELDGQHTMLQTALPMRFFDSVMVTHNVFLQNAALGIFPLAHQADAGVLVMMPLNQPPTPGSGLVSRESASENIRRLQAENQLPAGAPYDDPALLDFLTDGALAAGTQATLPQAAIRYVLDHREVSCALVGTTNPAHLEAAVAASEMPPLTRPVHAKAGSLFGKINKQVK